MRLKRLIHTLRACELDAFSREQADALMPEGGAGGFPLFGAGGRRKRKEAVSFTLYRFFSAL